MALYRCGGGQSAQILFVGASAGKQSTGFSTITSGLVNGKGCAITYTGYNDSGQNRTLNSITVQGSDDNSTWTNIGSTNSVTVGSGGFTAQTATFNNAKYKYYRVQGVASNLVSTGATLVVYG